MDAPATVVLALGAVLLLGLGALLGWALGRSGDADRLVPLGTTPQVPPALDAVLEAVSATALVLAPDDRVLRASPGAYAAGLVRGAILADRELAALVAAVRADGRARSRTLRLPRPGGPSLVLGAGAARVPAEPGAPLVVVLAEDLARSARVDDVRRDFVANVSHELKTPVGAIVLLGEALADAADDPAAVRRFAARVSHEAGRLGQLVQQLVELSRLQYDDPLAAPAPVLLDDVVGDAVDRVRVDAAANGIEIATGGEQGLVVLGSRDQLAIAVGNLVENAVAYSPYGSRVAIGVHRRDEQVDVAVTDQGIGIPEAELERVFERFYRLDPARSRNTGGSGLGLSIVKHVAATHAGSVLAWSVEGTGSTFTLRLPLYLPDGAPPAPVPVRGGEGAP